MTKGESTLFTRLLVARHSPKNGCHAQDGEVLIVKPKRRFPPRTLRIISSLPKMCARSQKYGWVLQVTLFTLQDFISKHLADRTLSAEEREHLRSMLTAAAPHTGRKARDRRLHGARR